MATLDVKKFISETKLRSVFSIFDTDGSGTITEDNLLFAFQKLGENLTKNHVRELIRTHDIKQDGVISWEEFKLIFTDSKVSENPQTV